MLRRACLLLALTTASVAALATAPAVAEPRLALVIGQGAYEAGELPTAVNDAGLVAQTLATAGFEVAQGRDLGTDDLRRTVAGFLEKVKVSPDDASVVVYVAGHALQMDGENFIVPVDARISRETDVAYDSLRLSDITRALAAAPGRTRVVVLDAARAFPTGDRGALARGLAIVDPAPGFLLALASAPSTTAPEGRPPYGIFATALVETMREPGIGLDDLFSRVRLQVHEASEGGQTPFHASNLQAPFTFFEPEDATASPAPAPEAEGEGAAPASVAPPARKLSIPEAGTVEEAYALAINADTIEGYQAFLKLYAETGYAKRVQSILAARREATVWKRTVAKPSTAAYWTYLKTYPSGPHATDCRRGLARLGASVTPPAAFEEIAYEDIPRPLPVEVVEVREVVTLVADAPRPPPPPVHLLPRRLERIVFAPPPSSSSPRALPIPAGLPLPPRARPPGRVPPIFEGPFSRPGLPGRGDIGGRPFPGGSVGPPDRRPGGDGPRPFPAPGTGQAGGVPLPPNGNPGPFRPRPLPGQDQDQAGNIPRPVPSGNPGPVGPRPLPGTGQAGGVPLPPNGNPGPFRPRPLPGQGQEQAGTVPLPRPNGSSDPIGPRPLPGTGQTGSLPLPANGNPGPFRPRPLPGAGQAGGVFLPPNGNPGPIGPRPLPGGIRPPVVTSPGRPPVQTLPGGDRAGPVLPGGARFPRGGLDAGSRVSGGPGPSVPVPSEGRLPDAVRPPLGRPGLGSRPPVVRPSLPSRFERLGPIAREPGGSPRLDPGARFRDGPGPIGRPSASPAFRQGPSAFDRRSFGPGPGASPSPRSFSGLAFRPQPSFRPSEPSFRSGGGGGFGGGGFRGGGGGFAGGGFRGAGGFGGGGRF